MASVTTPESAAAGCAAAGWVTQTAAVKTNASRGRSRRPEGHAVVRAQRSAQMISSALHGIDGCQLASVQLILTASFIRSPHGINSIRFGGPTPPHPRRRFAVAPADTNRRPSLSASSARRGGSMRARGIRVAGQSRPGSDQAGHRDRDSSAAHHGFGGLCPEGHGDHGDRRDDRRRDHRVCRRTSSRCPRRIRTPISRSSGIRSSRSTAPVSS